MDVREVMTPRVDVISLTIPVQAADVAKAVRETGHGSFPVVNGDLDDIVGVLYVNDLFRAGRRVADEDLAHTRPIDISRRLRTPLVMPETLGVLDALAEMRRQKRGFALVVDEYGSVAGVLTVKDLLEPLVGELHDEFDTGEEPSMVRVDANRWLIDGRASVDEVRDRLGIDVPQGEYVTLGGFLFAGFGHIPAEGERLELGEWDLKVEEMDKRRIAKVVARRRPVEAGAPSAPPAGVMHPSRQPAPPVPGSGPEEQADGGRAGNGHLATRAPAADGDAVPAPTGVSRSGGSPTENGGAGAQ